MCISCLMGIEPRIPIETHNGDTRNISLDAKSDVARAYCQLAEELTPFLKEPLSSM